MAKPPVRQIELRGVGHVPCLGQGTWHMGDDRARRRAEIESLRLGIELGMGLIDTAEMYGNGAAEQLVGEAIADCREQVTLVTKVLPSNASRSGVAKACRRSLARLGVAQIDIYLLHWRGNTPLRETVEAFELLREEGLIRAWGVSNFDTSDLGELAGLETASPCALNQILYNLDHRGIEQDLIPAASAAGVALMAYSPVGQGGALLRHPALARVAARHGVAPAQAALAWTLRHAGMISIPKAGNVAHVRENAAAAALHLTGADVAELDAAFPPPRRKVPLAML